MKRRAEDAQIACTTNNVTYTLPSKSNLETKWRKVGQNAEINASDSSMEIHWQGRSLRQITGRVKLMGDEGF